MVRQNNKTRNCALRYNGAVELVFMVFHQLSFIKTLQTHCQSICQMDIDGGLWVESDFRLV
jgi:hypothetical protein